MKVKDMILVGLFAALTCIGGFITIRIFTVPITLQLFFCSFAGILLGSKLGMTSQFIYVILGLLGIPVFVNGGGPGYVMQPTFGYLLGFIASAYVTGKIIEKAKQLSFINMFAAVMAGVILDYIIGMTYYYLICTMYLGQTKAITGVMMFMIPYIIKDTILSIIVTLTAWSMVPTLRKSGILTAKHIKNN